MAIFTNNTDQDTKNQQQTQQETAIKERGTKQTGSVNVGTVKNNTTQTNTQTGTATQQNLTAAQIKQLESTIGVLGRDASTVRDLAGQTYDRSLNSFAAQANKLKQQFNTDILSQINRTGQAVGSADSSAYQELLIRGKQGLNTDLAALAADVENTAANREMQAYDLLSNIVGKQVGAFDVLKGAVSTGRTTQTGTTRTNTTGSSRSETQTTENSILDRVIGTQTNSTGTGTTTQVNDPSWIDRILNIF